MVLLMLSKPLAKIKSAKGQDTSLSTMFVITVLLLSERKHSFGA